MGGPERQAVCRSGAAEIRFVADRFASAVIAQFAQRMFNDALELLAGTAKSFVLVGGLMIDGDGLTIGQARFHDAALVVSADLVAVLIAHVNFNAGDVFLETAEGVIQFRRGPALKRLADVDAAIGVDLNLHVLVSFFQELQRLAGQLRCMMPLPVKAVGENSL